MSDGENKGSASATPTPSETCKTALKHATLAWPRRDRKKDGIMGDQRHAKLKSDHNEGNAFDITHDPKNGVDCNILSKLVIDDLRVQYVIWNSRIYNRSIPGGWRKYIGDNPHDKHMHVSVKPGARDNTAAWPWSPNFAQWLKNRDRQMPPPNPVKLRGGKI